MSLGTTQWVVFVIVGIVVVVVVLIVVVLIILVLIVIVFLVIVFTNIDPSGPGLSLTLESD